MAQHNNSGDSAEKTVEKYLKSRGYKIIERNWKTKFAEIDIIAKKHKRLYFVEVKYRTNKSQGSGFDYITPRKLTQMKRAAKAWTAYNDWGGEYVLSAAEVTGDSFEVEFVKELIV